MTFKKTARSAILFINAVCAAIGWLFLLGFALGWSHLTWNGWKWP